jgi:prepilin-type N-terminal cleavage/methylation domain-containing protein
MTKGFTLIELLIVVAIIAILAAIAVPNFLEAQTRAKVTRAKADMRTAAIALEAYHVDNNRYAPDCYQSGGQPTRAAGCPTANWYLNGSITTPVAYITSASSLIDPFNVQDANASLRAFRYTNFNFTYAQVLNNAAVAEQYISRNGGWQMSSDGPDKVYSPGSSATLGDPGLGLLFAEVLPYDPTNGTISNGDIIRTQKFTDGLNRTY